MNDKTIGTCRLYSRAVASGEKPSEVVKAIAKKNGVKQAAIWRRLRTGGAKIADPTSVIDRFAEALSETGDITASCKSVGIGRDYGKTLFKRIRAKLGPQAR